MKSIILAGGLGTRLLPLTNIENKHMLPVFNMRMIELPIMTLVEAGLKDIILITGGKHPGRFLEFLKNGHSFGIKHLYYAYQEGEGGIADAMKLAFPFMEYKEPCVVILGDNYFEEPITPHIQNWMKNPHGARIILKEVEDPQRFGVVELDKSNQITSIEEKPTNPKSNLAITGCYFFDYFVWDFVQQISPSERGELEITDILSIYRKLNLLGFYKYEGYWSDMGTFETLSKVSSRIEKQ